MAEADQRFVFEAVKMQMTQTKDGWALALRVHPDDLSMELMRLPVGQRVGIALVPIDDDDGAFRNKEMMARVQREEKFDNANKNKFNTLLNAIIGSPYLHMWAEEVSDRFYDDQSSVQEIKEYVLSEAGLEGPWEDRYLKLKSISEQIQKYVR
tara:strand:- start:60 stop:518 length:459 start_codon:yes stop_codon:yes gene_type:complete